MTIYLRHLKHVTYVKALRSIGYASVVVITLRFLSVVSCLKHAKCFLRSGKDKNFINAVHLTHLKCTDALHLNYLICKIKAICMRYAICMSLCFNRREWA